MVFPTLILVRAYFRKVGHAHGINKIRHILVNLEQFQDDPSPVSKEDANLIFVEFEDMNKRSKWGH